MFVGEGGGVSMYFFALCVCVCVKNLNDQKKKCREKRITESDSHNTLQHDHPGAPFRLWHKQVWPTTSGNPTPPQIVNCAQYKFQVVPSEVFEAIQVIASQLMSTLKVSILLKMTFKCPLNESYLHVLIIQKNIRYSSADD